MNRLFREHTRVFEFLFCVIHHLLVLLKFVSLCIFKSFIKEVVVLSSFQITQNLEIIRTKDATVRTV